MVRSLTYGQISATGRAVTLARDAQPKYLAFEVDLGGWNNILMHFEIMVVLAWITGRTLVLPPKTPFYLLSSTPRSLLDFFDREALRRHIEVLTPEEFAARRVPGADFGSHRRFHEYMRDHGHSPGWDAVHDALAHPPNALTARLELIPRLYGRRPVGVTADAESCEILYFPMARKPRMFGVFEAFFLFADARDERRARTLARDAIRYRREIIQLAERALQSPPLAGNSFSAMHIRRGDFQYKETRVTAKSIIRHTENLFRQGQTLYLATDESAARFLRPLRQRFVLVTFDSLPRAVTSATPAHWIGIVETLICAAAPERFVGTRLSTFSARIATLRGHLSCSPHSDCAGVDTALYYTQPPLQPLNPNEERPYAKPLRKHEDELGETALPWWESVEREPIWSRAYRAVWAETCVDD